MSRIVTLLVTVPNIVCSETDCRKRGERVEEIQMVLPSTAITRGQLRRRAEVGIELLGLHTICRQADVYLGNRLLQSYQPIRKHSITRS